MATAQAADGHPVTRPRLASAVFAAAMAAVSLVAPAPAAAGDASTTTLPPATPGPPPAESVAPPGVVLAPPGANEEGRRLAQADLKAAESSLKKAVATARQLTRRLPALRKRQGELFVAITQLRDQDRVATDELTAARQRVRDLAIAGYVIGGDVPPVDYLLRADSPAELARRHTLVRTATKSKAEALDEYQAAKENASTELLGALHEADEVNASARQVESEIAVANSRVETLRSEVDNRKQLLDVITAASPVGNSDIPRLFLDAYRKAAGAMQKRAAHCRVAWPAVAAIGKVESNHGRYRGAQLALNGDVYPRIIGIPLDGTRNTRVIKDTDKGQFDLDTEYDRAVGPMQFIPSTWTRIAQDGNGDGTKDANNAYDAALGTAAYLCRAVPAGGLDTEEAIRRAFYSYNHSNAYVDHVLWWMRAFESLTL
jgi:membrane-bound lytic murein transglycosylase B